MFCAAMLEGLGNGRPSLPLYQVGLEQDQIFSLAPLPLHLLLVRIVEPMLSALFGGFEVSTLSIVENSPGDIAPLA